jgi:hypothetical protein
MFATVQHSNLIMRGTNNSANVTIGPRERRQKFPEWNNHECENPENT